MSMFASQWFASTGASAYLLEQSLLFNPADSAYLNRTPSSTGDTRTWTFSAWVKFASGTNYNMLMGHRRDGGGASTQTQVVRSSSGALMFFNSLSGSIDANLSTEALFRDTSAWYHIVYIVDTTEATDTNRVKIIVNGTQQTIAAGADWPALNATTRFNEASRFMYVGALNDAADNPYLFHGGLMAEVHFVDGTAVAANNFGEEDDDGFWNPIEYTGSYGTNGFQLKFADTSAFGDDTSGNTNDYTSNNFTAADQLEDTPTDSSGDGIGNFSALNPNFKQGTAALSEGNLKIASSSGFGGFAGTVGMDSGKYYWEQSHVGTVAGNFNMGVCRAGVGTSTSITGNAFVAVYEAANNFRANGSNSGNFTPSVTTDCIIGWAYDADARKLWMAVDNTFVNLASAGTGNPATGANPTATISGTDSVFPIGQIYNASGSKYAEYNFGQKPFDYTPPTGFVALATQEFPTPTIADGSLHMNTVIYTGNGTAIGSGGNAITGVGFQPDFVWIKNRDATDAHRAFDSVRGATKYWEPDTNIVQVTNTETLTSFNSDGFTVGNEAGVNTSSEDYVAWCWKAGGSASSNTDGSITTSLSVNAEAGFSIATYSGNSTAGATLGHGLGAVPEWAIFKNMSAGGNNEEGEVYHVSVGNANAMELPNNNAEQASQWNNTTPTSSVFTVGGGARVNQDTMVAYFWTPIEGFSRFGSYTGNGSADGPFVYTGFRPSFVMTKRTNSSGDWRMQDTTRVPYNPFTGYLRASTNEAELSGGAFDFLSNGFKIRNNDGEINASGGAFIYMAFAEHPFQGADGITQARAR